MAKEFTGNWNVMIGSGIVASYYIVPTVIFVQIKYKREDLKNLFIIRHQ